jgi:hypothetical protein
MASIYFCPPSGASIGRGSEPPRLLDPLRFALWAKHYAYQAEQVYQPVDFLNGPPDRMDAIPK